MHSLWQEKIKFPYYPILKSDQKVDVLFIGATLKNAIEAHFQMKKGHKVMLIEKKSIGQMPELGGMGILRAHSKEEKKDLHRLRDYIIERDVRCDMKQQSDTCIWVHPIKLFLFMTRDIKVCEQTRVQKIKQGKVDVGNVYIHTKRIVEDLKKETYFVHVFEGESFPNIKGNYDEMRSYRNYWLLRNKEEELEGEDYHWKV